MPLRPPHYPPIEVICSPQAARHPLLRMTRNEGMNDGWGNISALPGDNPWSDVVIYPHLTDHPESETTMEAEPQSLASL